MVQNDISIGFLNYLCNWTCAWDGTIFAPLALCNHIMKWWLTIARRVRIGKEYLGRYQVAVPILSTTFYLKMGPPRPLFVYFRSFQTQIVQKNYRLQRDSNSDRRSRRRARWPLDHHHGLAHFINVPVFWLYLHDPIDTVSNLVFWSCQVNNLEPWHIVFIMQQ